MTLKIQKNNFYYFDLKSWLSYSFRLCLLQTFIELFKKRQQIKNVMNMKENRRYHSSEALKRAVKCLVIVIVVKMRQDLLSKE